MAEESVSNRIDLLKCPICHGTFDDPVLIGDCAHTFCRQCIERVQAPLRCPTCRVTFTSRSILPNFALRALLPEQGGLLAPAIAHESRVSKPLVRQSTASSFSNSDIPPGLAELIKQEDSRIATRLFLLDNSGSTSYPDGQYLEAISGEDRMQVRKCTRWEEVCHTAMEQARWNLQLGTPCEFFLLNPLARGDAFEEGLDFQRVDAADKNGEAQLKSLEAMLAATSPNGITPIADRLRKIHARIAPEARDLARHGQKVVLVIVTDGLPTSMYSRHSGAAEKQELIQELRRLSYDLPMHLVVRLCTNDDSIADFYNAIDEETELELEVIDDMVSEAREIWNIGNRWLVYSPLIHRMREGGTLMKLFDLLDERSFNDTEVFTFCQLLLRRSLEDKLPRDAHEFCLAVRERLPELMLVYDPLRRFMAPPIRAEEVEWAVLPQGPLKRVCGSICHFM